MTVIPSVPRARAPRRRPLRRLAATGAIVALLLGFTTPAWGSATPDPTATAAPGVAELTLVPANGGVVRGGEDLAVTVAFDNGTSRTSGLAAVGLALGDGALPDRTALSAWLAGDASGVSLREVGSAPLDPVAAGGVTNVSVRVAADDPALAGRTPGIYPVLATTIVDGEPLSSPSVMVVPDDAAPAVGVGLVVPITGPPLTTGLLNADQLTALTAADGSLTAQLDAVEGTTAILAVDPALPAAVRVLGDAAPPSASAWLDRLLALPNSRFALQFGDADLATQVQAGLTQPIGPTSLISYLPNGTVVSPATSDPTASAPPATGGGVVTDVAGLTDIGPARANVYWPVTGTTGPSVVGTLGALGTPEAPALTLIASENTAAGSSGARADARLDVAASAVLVYDSPITRLLTAAVDETDASRRAATLVAANAHLTLADGGPPLLVAIDRGAARSAASLSAAIATVAAAPGVVPLALSQLATPAASATTEVTDLPADGGRVADLLALLHDENTLFRFATILDDPSLLTGRERAEILQLLGAAWRADAVAAHAAVIGHQEATVATLGSVRVLASGVINLVSYNSVYRPFVQNGLPWPINLTLVARPDDPRLIIQTRTEVVGAGPSSNTRVEVPVEAQIANGRVSVAMQLYSPTGEPIGTTESIDVEVHADWETIGLVILAVLVVLFIGVGIARTVLHRRAAKRAEESSGVDA